MNHDLPLTALFAKYHSEIKQKAGEATTRARQEQKEQYQAEMEILNDNVLCPFDPIDPDQLITDKVARLIRNDFDNPEAMLLISCMVKSIANLSINTGLGPYFRIRHWLENLFRVGGGAFGTAYQAELDQTKEAPFIIKTAVVGQEVSLTHEYFVATYGINQLRNRVPNFSYIYGGARCSEPELNFDPKVKRSVPVDNKVVDWCTIESSYLYLIYEKIEGQVIEDALNDMTDEDFYSLIIQLTYGLAYAYSKIRFTHYDAHIGNIIKKKLEGFASINYPTANGDKYVNANFIPVFIDFGNAHFRYKNKPYGNYAMLEYGVIPKKSFPMGDIYRFIVSCYQKTRAYTKSPGNPKVSQMAAQMLTFFIGNENVKEVAEVSGDYLNFLPRVDKFLKMTHAQFADYISKLYPSLHRKIVTDQPMTNTLVGCRGEKICLTRNQILNQIKLDSVTELNYFEFYDLANRLKGESSDQFRNLIQSYDINLGLSEIGKRDEFLASQLKEIGQKVEQSRMSISELGNYTLFDQSVVLPYSRYLALLAKLNVYLTEARVTFEIIDFILENYQVSELELQIDLVYNSAEEIFKASQIELQADFERYHRFLKQSDQRNPLQAVIDINPARYQSGVSFYAYIFPAYESLLQV